MSYTNDLRLNSDWTSRACSTWPPVPGAAFWYGCRSSETICWRARNTDTDNVAKNRTRICNADTSSSSGKKTCRTSGTDASGRATRSCSPPSCAPAAMAADDAAVTPGIGFVPSSRSPTILKPMSSQVNNCEQIYCVATTATATIHGK